ncbi:ATP-binding protein [Limnochorda pilosa]|uniref:Orc1-like AAA ATPase domain-containing protein n=1 Tax=Limnochorda pilosa TaxID=1555112 RepID=A0A0K2SIJ3_LIMPI|nr:ATP-binding protein [Limnochorda pilosa]BAS26910.1 hypothetical protein LIP_1053 [Limnochorda pilosa]
MEPLSVSIARERSCLFVGRAAELAALDQWLATAEAPTRVFYVTGMGGIGKSTLLLQMLERARHRGVTGVWIDGRACTPTPVGFLAYLGAILGLGGRPTVDQVLASVLPTQPGGRFVWCVDNYEALQPLYGWLWESFLTGLPAVGQLLVVASRQALTDPWRTDPGWRPRVRHMPLDSWTPAEAAEYLQRVGIPARQIGALVRGTGGQPLAVALAADAFPLHPEAVDQVTQEAARQVSAALLRETAGTRLEPLLDVLTVVPEADPELFRRVLEESPSGEHLLALARLSFVQALASGFRLHDVARQHLLADLRERDAERFRRLRRQAVQVLIRRLDTARKERRRSIAASLLTVCADTLPSDDAYATLSASFAGSLRTATPRDLPALHPLADGWGRQPFELRGGRRYRDLLTQVVERFPQGVRVVLGERGEPLAFLATVLLYDRSVALLDAVEPGALARHLPEEYHRLATLPADAADTYLALMVGVTGSGQDSSGPGLAEDELVGLLMRDGLAHLGEGARALLTATHPALQHLLGRLGFIERQDVKPPGASEPPPGRLYELDLRGGRFGPWVLSFLEETDGPAVGPGKTEALSAPALRNLLKAWHDPATWQLSPVPAVLHMDGPSLRAKFQKIFEGQERPPLPFTARDAELLRQTFVHERAPDLIASDLHLSRATYYRHLMRALERLAAALSF